MSVLDRVLHRIKREFNLQVNRRRVDNIARSNRRVADNGDKTPVIIFNASTRISGLSLNAGFSLVTGLALKKYGIQVHHLVCAQGLHPCVLGTDRDDPSRLPTAH